MDRYILTDCCGLVPGRTASTIAAYRNGARLLFSQAQPASGLEDVQRLQHAIAWFTLQNGRWRASSIRVYRACLRNAIQDLELSSLVESREADRLLEVLLQGPVAKLGRHSIETSAKKRTSARQQEVDRLISYLGGRKDRTSMLLASWLYFGPRLGLRPCEWVTAKIHRDQLTVNCAKRSNGRAVDDTRTLLLTQFSDDDRLFLSRFLQVLAKTSKDAPSRQSFMERLSKALRRACERTGSRHFRCTHCAISPLRRQSVC